MDKIFENAKKLKVNSASRHAIQMLVRLTEKVERVNAIQHSGGYIEMEDWSELYQLTNEARALLQSDAIKGIIKL